MVAEAPEVKYFVEGEGVGRSSIFTQGGGGTQRNMQKVAKVVVKLVRRRVVGW